MNKIKSLDDCWPLPFRKLTRELVQQLSEEDFYSLCQLVYRRALRQHSTSHQARQLIRRLIERRLGSSRMSERGNLAPEMLLAKYRENAILNALLPNRHTKWLPPVRRKTSAYFNLNNFSFVDSPQETMHQLSEIALAECTARAGQLDFGDSNIVDIAPYVVWGLMSEGMAPFLLGGTMGTSVKKVIEAVGLRRFMRMNQFKGLRDHKDVWAFPLRQRNPGTPTAEPSKAISFSRVADQLVETVNEWLGALPVPMELTLEACGQLNKMATEMLDNAERHGGHATAIGDWYVAGFMARRNDNSNTQSSWYECHIAIVNLGTTIAESISRSSEPQMLSDLRTYTAKHTGRRRQSTDALTTVYAMQDGVSSLPQGKGGMGMMEMVELVNALGTTSHQAHQPAITIISGRSCVRFAGPFKGFSPTYSARAGFVG